MEICRPQFSDLPQIVEIYNQAIRNRFSTGFQEEYKVEEMIDWFHEHSGQKFPMIIAKEGEEVLGWTLIKPYRKDRAVFDTTVEISYFIHNSHHKKGIGFQLVNEMQKMASQIGYRTIIAIVMSENLGSIRLMEKCDFSLWGEMPKVGLVDGVEIDHLYFGKHLIQK